MNQRYCGVPAGVNNNYCVKHIFAANFNINNYMTKFVPKFVMNHSTDTR